MKRKQEFEKKLRTNMTKIHSIGVLLSKIENILEILNPIARIA